MTNQQLPRTDSIQELAKFWDNHDMTRYSSLQLDEVHHLSPKAKLGALLTAEF